MSPKRVPIYADHAFWHIFLIANMFLWFCFSNTANTQLFLAINTVSRLIPDTLLAHITEFGNGVIIGSCCILLAVKRLEISLRVFMTVLLSAIVINILKDFYALPRPPSIFDHDSIRILGKAYEQGSFPSGHSATASGAAGLIWLTYQNKFIRRTALGIMIAVCLSRVSAGVHWPQDIAFGAALGWILAYLAALLTQKATNQKTARYLLMILSSITLVAALNQSDDLANILSVTYVRWLLALSMLLIILFQLEKLGATALIHRQRT